MCRSSHLWLQPVVRWAWDTRCSHCPRLDTGLVSVASGSWLGCFGGSCQVSQPPGVGYKPNPRRVGARSQTTYVTSTRALPSCARVPVCVRERV